MRILFLSLLIVIASGCVGSKQERAKRKFQSLAQKFPELVDTVYSVRRDTLVNRDTIITKTHHLDSVWHILHDSVFIIGDDRVRTEVRVIDREKIRVITNVKSDTIIRTDTVFRVVEREVQVIDTTPIKKRRKVPGWIIGFFVGIVITAGALIVKKIWF